MNAVTRLLFLLLGIFGTLLPKELDYSFQNYWEQTDHMWDFGFIAACDKGVPPNPKNYFLGEPQFNKNAYNNIQPGDIVWVHCRFLHRFYNELLPNVQHPFVLLLVDGDETFPNDCAPGFDVEKLLAHPLVIHLFAQNNTYSGTSKKVSSFPIGMDFHTIAYKGKGGWGEVGSPRDQEKKLYDILRTLKPTHERIPRAFVDFHHADTMHAGFARYLEFGEDRKTIFERLLPTGTIEHGPWMRRSALWQTKGRYAFSISPHGNGLDCHRTWEDLVLGCIVIVKTSPLDTLYTGLPVVIVKDWSEITQDTMAKWLKQYGDAFTNHEYRKKLTHQYWFSLVQHITRPYRT